MPQRTNWFQKLIRVIEGHLAPENSRITESALLRDRITGADREVDILIETQVGQHPVSIAIECVGGESRPADVTWVEKIACKHEHLPIDRSILVSKSGFSKNAEAKARALGMETLTLSDALSLDWRSRLSAWPDVLKIKRPRITHTEILLTFEGESDLDRVKKMSPETLSKAILYTESGEALGTFSALMQRVLSDPQVRELHGKYPVPGNEGFWVLPVELADAEKYYVLNSEGEEIRLRNVKFVGLMKVDVDEVPWQRRVYGDVAVRYAAVPFEDNTVTIVATEKRDGGPTVQLFLSKPAGRRLVFEAEGVNHGDEER